MSFHVLDVVELGRERIIDVDSNNFPIRFTFVKKSHCAENLDLFDLAWVAYFFANLAHVNRIIVTLCLGLRMRNSRILPRLPQVSP